jgi:hypothetical protein
MSYNLCLPRLSCSSGRWFRVKFFGKDSVAHLTGGLIWTRGFASHSFEWFAFIGFDSHRDAPVESSGGGPQKRNSTGQAEVAEKNYLFPFLLRPVRLAMAASRQKGKNYVSDGF